MSIDYAAGLSHCDDLGTCGLEEVFDKLEDVREKVKLLAAWLRQFDGSCVVHVGAGLSTSAGIRDFRGKGGVWTELLLKSGEQQQPSPSQAVAERDSKLRATGSGGAKGEQVVVVKLETQKAEPLKVKPFDETVPTLGHMVLKALCQARLVSHIVSQNVDGLFLKSNLKRNYISELHGNFYLDECTKCRYLFIRPTASATMRLQKSTTRCPRGAGQVEGGSKCNGYLRDTILDWESPIPHNELRVATRESKRSKLHICIGTSLQLRPSKDLVCKPGRGNKLVMVNLQPTKFDQQADLVIHYYADFVMEELARELDLEVPVYEAGEDPTKDSQLIGKAWRKD